VRSPRRRRTDQRRDSARPAESLTKQIVIASRGRREAPSDSEAIRGNEQRLDCFVARAHRNDDDDQLYFWRYVFDDLFFADFRVVVFALLAFLADFFAAFFGTFLPSARASDSPIAIACLRLVTFLFERPIFNVPSLRFFIARSTLAEAFLEYVRAMTFSLMERK
jgi:hypothetical protein